MSECFSFAHIYCRGQCGKKVNLGADNLRKKFVVVGCGPGEGEIVAGVGAAIVVDGTADTFLRTGLVGAGAVGVVTMGAAEGGAV